MARSSGRRLAKNGLAGITIALPYMLILMATGMLIGFGAAAQVSIKLGEKQTEEAERVLGNAALLAVDHIRSSHDRRPSGIETGPSSSSTFRRKYCHTPGATWESSSSARGFRSQATG